MNAKTTDKPRILPDVSQTVTDKPTGDKAPETKADAFKRLASARASKAIDAMRQLPHLANAHSYEWTPEQVTAIVDALQREVDAIKVAFAATDKKKAVTRTFSL